MNSHPLARVAAFTLLAAAALGATSASAQEYPTKPVKIIVPFAPGGSADVYGRAVAVHLQEVMKQTFIVENRPGAGSLIGTEAVAKSAPDGYTLLLMSNTHTVNESLFMRPGQWLTRALVWVDNRGVDGAVNGLAAGLGGSSSRLGRTQTGFVRSYALGMLGGAVLVAGALLAVTSG